MFVGFFTAYLGVPNAVMYLGDLLCIAAFFLGINRILKLRKNTVISGSNKILMLLLAIGTVSAVTYGFRIELWVWALRNWGRFFVFFVVCAACLNKQDIEKTLDFVTGFYHLNTLMVIVQYVFFRNVLDVDARNGFWGRDTSGVNITMTLIVLVIVFSQYYTKRCTRKKLIIYIAETGLVAVLAELKATFFFIIIFLICYTLVSSKRTLKQIIRYSVMILVTISLLMVFVIWLEKVYPIFDGFFSLSRLIADSNTAGGYGYSGYIDRLSAIPVINQYFFNEMGLMRKLFGIGIGNAEYSAYEWLQSTFYIRYGESFQYLRFTSADLYLETGIIGLVLYTASVGLLCLSCVKRIGKLKYLQESSDALYYQNIGMGIGVVSLIFIIYNNLQRADISFILAFFLAIAFAGTGQGVKKNAADH
jgi:hypothetical protein